MAHKIETMMSVRSTPWHGLGKVVNSASITEAIDLAGLNWRVRLDNIQTEQGVPLPQFGKAVVRESDNKHLGLVGPKWHPLQNSEMFDWFKPFCDSGEAEIETAGSIAGGRIVWALARCGMSQEIRKGDSVNNYILLSNSHDGSTSVRVGFTPIRVVCWNTLSASHRDTASKLLRVRHTSRVVPTLVDIRNIMEVAKGEFEATAEQYRKLARRKINKDDLRKYVTVVLAGDDDNAGISTKMSNMIEKVVSLAINGRGNDEMSAWTAYNSITEYYAWERGTSADTRAESNWFGKSADDNVKALELALAL